MNEYACERHPAAEAPPPGGVEAARTVREAASARLELVVGRRLDLEELWRLRRSLWSKETPADLELDLGSLRQVDADALFLLYEDLLVLARGEARVRLRAVPLTIRRRLRRHPIVRFLLEDEEVFTDPDLEALGFRPSRH